MQTTLSGNTSRKPYPVVGRGKWRRGNRKMVTEEVFHLTFPLDKTSQQQNIFRAFTQLWKISLDKGLTFVNCLVPG